MAINPAAQVCLHQYHFVFVSGFNVIQDQRFSPHGQGTTPHAKFARKIKTQATTKPKLLF